MARIEGVVWNNMVGLYSTVPNAQRFVLSDVYSNTREESIAMQSSADFVHYSRKLPSLKRWEFQILRWSGLAVLVSAK